MAFAGIPKSCISRRSARQSVVGLTLAILFLLCPATPGRSSSGRFQLGADLAFSRPELKIPSHALDHLIKTLPSSDTPSEIKRRTPLRRKSPFFNARSKRSKPVEVPSWRSYVADAIRLFVFLVIGYLVILWRRGKKPSQNTTYEQQIEVLRQVRTQAPQGSLKVNPAGFSKEAIIINESAKAIIHQKSLPSQPIPPSAERPLEKVENVELWENMDLFGQDEAGTRSKISEAVDRMIGEFRDPEDQSNEKEDFAQKPRPRIIRRRAPTLKLPVPLLGQFEGRFGEKLLWNGPYWHRPGLEGWMAVTNQRLIWITDKKKPVFSKDLLHSELDRGQISISAIVSTEIARLRMPELLILPLPFVLWFPYGTAISIAILAAHLTIQRSMLKIATRDEAMHFPLKNKDLREAAKCLEKLLQKRADEENQGVKKQDAWRKAN